MKLQAPTTAIPALLTLVGAFGMNHAQAHEPHTPPKHQSGGKANPPNWNGVWVIADDFMDKQDGTETGTLGRFDPNAPAMGEMPPFKGEYLAFYNQVHNAETEGKAEVDLGAACLPPGMPAFWDGPYAFEFMQTPKQINFYQEFDAQTRRVYLDSRKHPTDLDATYMGHSVGHWEGQVLVIDTVNVRGDTIMTPEGRHSDAIHTTEHIREEAPNKLLVEEIIEDPKALTKPFTVTWHLHRKPKMEIMEYECAQNNRNPVDSNGRAGATLESK
jgi:hypothetical protein